MNVKKYMLHKIWQIDFALHELVLYLDSHPDCEQALSLMRDYKRLRADAVNAYESKFGKLITTASDVEPTGTWKWIDGPWPWENDCEKG